LHGIIGLEVNCEQVRATHPLVHCEFGGHLGLFPGLQGRRTDDRLGGSAALDGFNLWIDRQAKGLVADILQPEAGLNPLLESDRTEVNQLLINLEPWAPERLARLTQRASLWKEVPRRRSDEDG
jgi:hypothetical protein